MIANDDNDDKILDMTNYMNTQLRSEYRGQELRHLNSAVSLRRAVHDSYTK